jgi:hypothetical protein
MREPSAAKRAELAFRAFRNMGSEGKQHAMKRWIKEQSPEETKQLALFMQILILKDKIARNRQRDSVSN